MTILLTGCAGFIGSHLLEKFLREGYNVVGVDNLSLGTVLNMRDAVKNIPKAVVQNKFKFYRADVTDKIRIDQIVQKHRPTAICHQAAIGSVPRSITEPVNSYQTNVVGMINIMEAARCYGIKRVIFASSSSVYGDSNAEYKIEGYEGNSLSPYAASKVCGEEIAFNYGRVYSMEVLGLRYFNVFGPRQAPDGQYAAVIPRWVRALRCEASVVINGDGLQSRDFTYVKNVVDANMLAITAPNPAAFNKPFNIACQASTSLNGLVQMLSEIIKPKVCNIVYGEPRRGDIKNSLADITLARVCLGYEPRFNLKTGLEESFGNRN
jgi:UDP-N-acetylglucosamine 4-epimerase